MTTETELSASRAICARTARIAADCPSKEKSGGRTSATSVVEMSATEEFISRLKKVSAKLTASSAVCKNSYEVLLKKSNAEAR
jgi:hypothetical protein